MPHPIAEPVFTTVLPHVSRLTPARDSLYVTGTSVEERSTHTEEWEASCQDVTFARMRREDGTTAEFSVDGDSVEILHLRDAPSIVRFFETNSRGAIYLDITGLPHRVWAPLLRGMRARPGLSFCVYVEPGDYRFSAVPTEAAIFDLSETREGIAPLPGFAAFPEGDDDALFVPLLGFEGARFAYMLEAVQPKPRDIFPVVGVPGFRPEYPFYAYGGNRMKLWETMAWKNVLYAAANCPFSLYQLLERLSTSNPSRRMIVAPIGTKPHALGSILYCLNHARTVEILYDHPVRKKRRTLGTSRVCLYDVSLLPPRSG